MKILLYRSILLILCLSVLTGSVGRALPERFCRMMGFSAGPVPVLMAEGCCAAEKSAAPTPAEDCCELEVTYQKLEPVSGLHFPAFAFASLSPALLALCETLLFTSVPDSRVTLRYADSSPPRYGRHLLSLLQTLLI